MIERLDSIREAWNEDTVRVIKKVNEIVDILNGENGKKATPNPREIKERGRVKGKAYTKAKETVHHLPDKSDAKAKAGITTTAGTITPKKEKDTSARGG